MVKPDLDPKPILATVVQDLPPRRPGERVTPAAPSSPGAARGPALPPEGDVIGGVYRVNGSLGAGAMGVILRAYDERLEREVAIKLLHPAQSGNRDMQRRFLEEARAMARVHHPNVMEVFAFGEHRGAPYFVMPVVEGASLHVHAPAGGAPRFSLDEALRILDQICFGVAAIHRSGVVHRDLKPSNILLGEGLEVVVADLGLAWKYMQESDAEHGCSGTPAYIAPEVIERREIEPALVPRRDIYALGLIAYLLLTGRLPFGDVDITEILRKHVEVPPPPPSRVWPELPAAFDEAILGALAKDPAARTPTPEAFRQALHRARRAAPVATRPLHALVVDDNPEFRTLLGRLLRVALPGAQVEEAPEGAAALEIIKARRPDVAVFDLEMPVLDGLGLLAAVRALPGGDFPIIVATGTSDVTAFRRLSQFGASAFLVKPFEATQFITLARALAGLAERQRA